MREMDDTNYLWCHGHKITIPYHASTGLPILTTALGISAYVTHGAHSGTILLMPTSSVCLSTTTPQDQPINLVCSTRECQRILVGALRNFLTRLITNAGTPNA
jgi:hypothetical protein